MNKFFIIMKCSRWVQKPSFNDAYRGPTCLNAQIEPGKIYTEFKEAISDCQKLSIKNPVGFRVIEIKSDER